MYTLSLNVSLLPLRQVYSSLIFSYSSNIVQMHLISLQRSKLPTSSNHPVRYIKYLNTIMLCQWFNTCFKCIYTPMKPVQYYSVFVSLDGRLSLWSWLCVSHKLHNGTLSRWKVVKSTASPNNSVFSKLVKCTSVNFIMCVCVVLCCVSPSGIWWLFFLRIPNVYLYLTHISGEFVGLCVCRPSVRCISIVSVSLVSWP